MQHEFIVMLSAINVTCFLMHEMDACNRGEWRMFKILNGFEDKQQYLIFLYLHIPIILLFFYYLLAAVMSTHMIFWMVVNVISALHLLVHLVALKWRSNVFTSVHSFIFIGGSATAAVFNLCFLSSY